MKVCIVGASGKLGQYLIQHSLDRGYEVVGVCRPASVVKLDRFEGASLFIRAPQAGSGLPTRLTREHQLVPASARA
jgi:nucleoside-diphosphate-sugar epimerase